MKGAHEKGQSWDCVGQLPTPHKFWWRETEHVNSHSWCLYTPMKGVMKLLIRTSDVAVFFGTLGMMMLKDDPELLEVILRPLILALKGQGREIRS